jgi:hypothetical protein
MMRFTATTNSITLVLDGKSVMLNSDDANFVLVSEAAQRGDEESVLDLLDHNRLVKRWSNSKFWLNEKGEVVDNDGPLPQVLHKRIMAMIRDNQKPTALFNFWSRLKGNPSNRSVTQLWDFLQHSGIPLTDSGYFLAYKSVRSDFKDHHSNKWENHPGKVLSMPRNKISDDPRTPCHEGFHVGALRYAEGFGLEGDRKLVICKVDPADVVCVPYDESAMKMRVCKYEVVGIHGTAMPDTVVHDTELPVIEKTAVTSLEEEVETQKTPRKGKRELTDEDILSMPLEDLRKYASNVMNIIGASKIPGGKWALLEVVLSNRK